jgi:methyltransferase (TIGR00027 family)
MERSEPLLRNISDTAFWPATYRARETERSEPLIRDPFARRLIGDRGERIATTLRIGATDSAFGAVRTYLFDKLILDAVRDGADMVLSLAAGLDSSPYRLSLPPHLQWVEVDLPGILDYKEKVLRDDRPACRLERFRLDLAKVPERRALFRQLNDRAKKIVVVTEGLLPYLTAEQVGSLAKDLAAEEHVKQWIFELSSPGLLRVIQRKAAKHLREAKAPLIFSPKEGPAFFRRFGWHAAEVHSVMKVTKRLGRLKFPLTLVAALPESTDKQGWRPWAGICLMTKD